MIHASKNVVALIPLYLAIIMLTARTFSDSWLYDSEHIFKILMIFDKKNKS